MLRKFGTFLPKNAFLLKSTKAFMKTLIDDLRKEAEKMRKKLKQLGSQKRHTFIGRFERVGYKKSYRYCRPTLLLTHVALAETGELITEHLWLNYTKGFLDLGELLTGDLLRFNGRVASYVKGYFGTSQKLDYKGRAALASCAAGQNRGTTPLAARHCYQIRSSSADWLYYGTGARVLRGQLSSD